MSFDVKKANEGSRGKDVERGQVAPGRRSRTSARYGVQLRSAEKKQRSLYGGDAQAVAQEGVSSGSGEQLPYLESIQTAFGAHDVSGVRAHIGGPAAEAAGELGALAYATGNDVAFGGQLDLHTAAHEAAHVVQQRAGVHLKGGIGQAGDQYEQHADAVADLVVAGKSAESLLGPMGTGAAPGVQCKPKNSVQTPDVLPNPPPGGSIKPTNDQLDGEGNKIEESGGHWHLMERPMAQSFPQAGGSKPQLLPVNPNRAYHALLARCEAIQAAQLAQAFVLKGDMKYWFAKVYYFVTVHELAAVRAGALPIPAHETARSDRISHNLFYEP